MYKKLKDYIDNQETLEDRIYFIIVVVGTLVMLASTIVTIAERLTAFSSLATIIGVVFTLTLLYVSVWLKRPGPCKVILVYIINLVVIPINYFSCGGMNSGMPLYLLIGLFLIVPILRGATRITAFAICLVVDCAMVAVSYFMMDSTPSIADIPANILTKLSEEAQTIDVLFSLILTATFIFFVTSMMLRAYQRERDSRVTLLTQMAEQSLHDELTQLYNRRYLFSHLEKIDIFSKKFFIAEFDLDHFRVANDTYGHLFGDHVLETIATEIMNGLDPKKDELAARYGGEEFVIIFQANSPEDAYRRCDKIRKTVESLQWNETNTPITISGGLIHCSDFTEITPMMARVDQMLIKAKKEGRNKIVSNFLD